MEHVNDLTENIWRFYFGKTCKLNEGHRKGSTAAFGHRATHKDYTEQKKSHGLESDQETESIQLKTCKFKYDTESPVHVEGMAVVRGKDFTLENSLQAAVLI